MKIPPMPRLRLNELREFIIHEPLPPKRLAGLAVSGAKELILRARQDS